MQNKSFLKFGWATLVAVFLVIVAGSVVRMSGSGMGCPDWPKCFGYIVPPTEEAQVVFQPNTSYNKGQMIVHGKELQSAKETFTSTQNYQAQNWETYEVHNYAIFNPLHTWVEYVNRLFGALSGGFMLVWFIWSLILMAKKRVKWYIPALLFLGVILLGFQAWLGKVVVDTHLHATILSAHMFGAIALIVVVLAGIRYSTPHFSKRLSKGTKGLLWVVLGFLLVQTYLGTKFRMVIDELTGHTASYQKDLSAAFSDSSFTIHLIFAFATVALVLVTLARVQKQKEWSKSFTYLALMVFVEMMIGFILKALDVPFLSQPMHLLIAFVLVTINAWLLLFKTERV